MRKAKRGRRLGILFADEARFGRINRPRPCWAPIGIRPEATSQLIREYIYLYGAVSPKDEICVYPVMPRSDTAGFQVFSSMPCRESLPGRISSGSRRRSQPSLPRPPASRQYFAALPAALRARAQSEVNPWEEIREKILKNYALKSIDAVRTKLKQAMFYIECNPETVKSITSFPYIRKSF